MTGEGGGHIYKGGRDVSKKREKRDGVEGGEMERERGQTEVEEARSFLDSQYQKRQQNRGAGGGTGVESKKRLRNNIKIPLSRRLGHRGVGNAGDPRIY